MPGHALLEITGSAVATLHTALETLDHPHRALQGRDIPGKREAVQAAERVKNDAAKIGVMCSEASGGAAALSADVMQSLIGAMQQSCLAFCSICYALGGASAGDTLRKDVRTLAKGIINPCVALLHALEGGGDLKRHIGVVWQGCDAVSKAALDNKGALFKGMAGVMAVLKDTLREMEELAQDGASSSGYESDDEDSAPEAAEAGAAASEQRRCGGESSSSSSAAGPAAGTAANGSNAAAAVGGGGVEGGEVGGERKEVHDLREIADLDFNPGKLSSHERELLSSCQQLMEASAAVVKTFGRVLLQGPPLSGGDGDNGSSSEALDSWESCLYHAHNLRRSVEDLGAAMYPPHDLDGALGAAEALATTLELMIDECPAPDAVGDALGQLSERLKAAQAQVETAAAAAGR